MNKAMPGAISGAIVTLIGVFVAFKLNAGRMDENDLQRKLDEKATKIELKDAIDQVKREVSIQNEWIIKTLDKIDKRTEKIEDKLNR